MKYTGPKAKLARRLGMNLFGSDKYDKILAKKPYGPGKNPKTRLGRDSEYAKQLKEKQKARNIYGLSEKQFASLYAQALKSKGRTGDQMKQLLEQRLDNVIYRAGFAMTRMQSRQFAGHGLFLVDGQRVTTPSYRLQPGQIITVRKQVKDSPVFVAIRDEHEKYTAPKWLLADSAQLKVEIVALPDAGDAEQAVDMRLVVEYYSRT
jgi:small subunit ribosomal protein S4